MIADNFMWIPAESSQQSDNVPIQEQSGEVKVEGETSDVWFKQMKAFEVSKFGFALKQSDLVVSPKRAVAGSDSSGGGRTKFQAFTVDKFVDLASVKLYQACCWGTTFGTVMLAIRKSGGSNLLYVQFMFREVAVTGITWGGGAGDSPPIETVTFEFEAMGFQYVQQKTDGTPGRRLLWSWNTKANKPGLNVKGLEPAPDFLSPTQA